MKATKIVTRLLEAGEEEFLQRFQDNDPFEEVRCVVCCTNASGEADYMPVVVQTTQGGYMVGQHYDVAKAVAEKKRYEPPFVVADEYEPLFKPFEGLNWAKVQRVPGYVSGAG